MDEKQDKKAMEDPLQKQKEHIEELSQKIFGKPTKELKYLLCTNFIHYQLLEEELARTGLYQWINVFNGEVKLPRDVEDYNKYDIIQVNLSAQDFHLIPMIKKSLGKNTKTKIIANNDYTTEVWGAAFTYPEELYPCVKDADMIFGTEYFQTTAVSELARRRCYVIPHPADIRRLKLLPEVQKKPLLTTVWRRYDNNYYVPSLAVRNMGLTTQLIGYDKAVDNKTYLCTCLYDYVLAGTNFFEFCDQLRTSKIVYDPFTFHSYSRTTVDTAAMGVAVVGSNRCQSVQVCYPHTCIDPWDIKSARELIKKLNEDEEFYKLVVETAKERSEFYNHTNSLERYLTALDDALNFKEGEEDGLQGKKEKVKPIGDDVNKLISVGKNREPSKKLTKEG